MIETFIIAATTFFATVGPFDVAAIYAALTTQANAAEKRKMAARGVLLAGVILFFFALFGENLLASMGVSLPAFSTAGGILLLLIGIEMVCCASFRRRLNNPGGKPGRCGKKRCCGFSVGHAAHCRPRQHGCNHIIVGQSKK